MNENEIQVFMNEVFGEIRILEQNDGKVLFCGKDVALALKYSNTNEAITRHCKEDGVVKRDLIDSLGRTQEASFITEGNLYRLITHSRRPDAEKFECWVFDDVLPAIKSAKAARMLAGGMYDKYSADQRTEIERIADIYLLDFRQAPIPHKEV